MRLSAADVKEFSNNFLHEAQLATIVRPNPTWRSIGHV